MQLGRTRTATNTAVGRLPSLGQTERTASAFGVLVVLFLAGAGTANSAATPQKQENPLHHNALDECDEAGFVAISADEAEMTSGDATNPGF